MVTKCHDCKVDLVTAQVSFHFNTPTSTEDRDDWPTFPVLAGICPKCGWMDLHVATPKQFTKWLNSVKSGEQWAKALPGPQGTESIPRR